MLQSILNTIAKPFVWLGGFFARLGAILRVVIGVILAVLLVLYGYLFLEHAGLERLQSGLRRRL